MELPNEHRKRHARARMLGGILASGLWLGFCVWMFAFSYSDSYFKYSHCSRIAVFAAALIGSAAIPGGAILVWRRFNGILVRVVAQLGVSLLSLFLLAATSFLLSRIRGACHLSGDDAMGAGINFLLLTAIATIAVAGMAIGAIVRSKRGPGARQASSRASGNAVKGGKLN